VTPAGLCRTTGQGGNKVGGLTWAPPLCPQPLNLQVAACKAWPCHTHLVLLHWCTDYLHTPSRHGAPTRNMRRGCATCQGVHTHGRAGAGGWASCVYVHVCGPVSLSCSGPDCQLFLTGCDCLTACACIWLVGSMHMACHMTPPPPCVKLQPVVTTIMPVTAAHAAAAGFSTALTLYLQQLLLSAVQTYKS
jgi:hypothetical protein